MYGYITIIAYIKMKNEDITEFGSNNAPRASQRMSMEEEEDSKLNFFGDKWLRNSFEMKQDQDEKKHLKQETKETMMMKISSPWLMTLG